MPISLAISNLPLWDALLAPFHYFSQFFIHGGWIIFALGLLFLLWEIHLYLVQSRFARSVKYTLLAIDVPKELKPNLKAVEHIYAQLFGIASAPNWVEKYFDGKFQLSISLELVSISGYIQFIVYAPAQYRDLIEAAIYAQYTDAQITVIEDYTAGFPKRFPDATYDVYGSGIGFSKPSGYPIKTYMAFEHTLSQELADPMASMLEVLGKLRPGEQIWIQMVITPVREGPWIKEAEGIIKKIIGEKAPPGPDLFAPVYGVLKGAWETATASVVLPGEVEKKREESKDKNSMQYLTGGEKNVVEGIQTKLSKLSYATKFRYVYIAEKALVNKTIGISAVFGALSQFATQDMNSFKPDKLTFTKSNFILFNKPRFAGRQHNLMVNYINRTSGQGIILNTEELATVFHFPTETVKAPLLKKTDARRSEPPVGLPEQGLTPPFRPVGELTARRETAPAALPEPAPAPVRADAAPAVAAPDEPTPPANLPFA